MCNAFFCLDANNMQHDCIVFQRFPKKNCIDNKNWLKVEFKYIDFFKITNKMQVHTKSDWKILQISNILLGLGNQITTLQTISWNKPCSFRFPNHYLHQELQTVCFLLTNSQLQEIKPFLTQINKKCKVCNQFIKH